MGETKDDFRSGIIGMLKVYGLDIDFVDGVRVHATNVAGRCRRSGRRADFKGTVATGIFAEWSRSSYLAWGTNEVVPWVHQIQVDHFSWLQTSKGNVVAEDEATN